VYKFHINFEEFFKIFVNEKKQVLKITGIRARKKKNYFIRIRNWKKTWIRIHNKSMRIRSPANTAPEYRKITLTILRTIQRYST
jgi:hypothetical protein